MQVIHFCSPFTSLELRLRRVQVPFFIICIFLARRYINYTFPAQKDLPSTFLGVIRRLDLPGCFLLAGWIGSALTAVSLVTNSTTGLPTWSSSEVIGLFVAAGVIFVVFVVWELKIVQYPVVPVEILHRRTPIAVAIHNMALSIIVFAQVSVQSLVKVVRLTMRIVILCPALLHHRTPHVCSLGGPTSHPCSALRYDRLARKRVLRPPDREILLAQFLVRDARASVFGSGIHMDVQDAGVSGPSAFDPPADHT